MSRQPLYNGEPGFDIRTKLNEMFTEIYNDLIDGLNFLGVLNTGDSVTGTPNNGDYYEIGSADTYGSVACAKFDRLIYSAAATAWQKVESRGAYYREAHGIIARSAGTPSTGDPRDISEITHTITGLGAEPEVIISQKCDWHMYIKSKSYNSGTGVMTVVVGVGSSGRDETVDYDLVVM